MCVMHQENSDENVEKRKKQNLINGLLNKREDILRRKRELEIN